MYFLISVLNRPKGINVAIHPGFVDAHMRWEGAIECVIAKRSKHYVIDNYRIAWLNAGETELNFKETASFEKVQENIERVFDEKCL